jgi:hypothetical protein
MGSYSCETREWFTPSVTGAAHAVHASIQVSLKARVPVFR